MLKACFFRIQSVKAGSVWLAVIAGMVFASVSVASDAADTARSPSSDSKTVIPLHLKGGLPETLPIPGDPRPYAKSPYAKQIDKALAYLVFKDREPNRLYRLALLDYLQRKHVLHERYSLKATLAPYLPEANRDDLGRMKRLIDPDYRVEQSVIDKTSPLERITLKALYCDVYPVEPALLEEMNTRVQEGRSPFLPTLGIAYLFLRDHGCLEGDPKRMLVRDALAVKFRNHLRDNGTKAHMVGQALAFLFELGHGDMVQEDWLTAVAKTQNADGSWNTAPGVEEAKEGNGMTTTHVLWALLEHALPDAPKTPLVREHVSSAPAEYVSGT